MHDTLLLRKTHRKTQFFGGGQVGNWRGSVGAAVDPGAQPRVSVGRPGLVTVATVGVRNPIRSRGGAVPVILEVKPSEDLLVRGGRKLRFAIGLPGAQEPVRGASAGYGRGERDSPATNDLPITMRLAEPPEPVELVRSA